MKFLIFKMFITLGILISMSMIYMGKLDPSSFFDSIISGGTSEFNALKAKAPKSLSSAVTDEKVQVYKWRDEHGVMQFTNTPPPVDKNAELVELDPNSNIIQAVKIPVAEEPKAAVKTEKPNPYSVGGMKKTIDAAKNVEKMMKQRQEKQMEMLGNI